MEAYSICRPSHSHLYFGYIKKNYKYIHTPCNEDNWWNPTRFRTYSPAKWNESGFRPPLCTYRLNWARRTSWGWWDDWDDTVLQTQDSKFEPWRSEAEHATSRSRRLPTILTFTRGWGRNICCYFQTAETGNRTPNSGVKGSGANHYPRTPALQSCKHKTSTLCWTNVGPSSDGSTMVQRWVGVSCLLSPVQNVTSSPDILNLSAWRPTLNVRIWRLWMSDSDV